MGRCVHKYGSVCLYVRMYVHLCVAVCAWDRWRICSVVCLIHVQDESLSSASNDEELDGLQDDGDLGDENGDDIDPDSDLQQEEHDSDDDF